MRVKHESREGVNREKLQKKVKPASSLPIHPAQQRSFSQNTLSSTGEVDDESSYGRERASIYFRNVKSLNSTRDSQICHHDEFLDVSDFSSHSSRVINLNQCQRWVSLPHMLLQLSKQILFDLCEAQIGLTHQRKQILRLCYCSHRTVTARVGVAFR